MVPAPWLQADPIEWESPRERDFIYAALPCPVVCRLKSQPLQVSYLDPQGKEHIYTPDYQVTLANGQQVLVEIKLAKFIDKHRDLFDTVAQKLAETDTLFYVLDERMVDTRRAEEHGLWWKYARGLEPQEMVQRAMDEVRTHGHTTVEDLKSLGISMPVIYHCLGRALLVTDAAGPLQGDSGLKFFDHLSDELVFFESWFRSTPWPARIHPGARTGRSDPGVYGQADW